MTKHTSHSRPAGCALVLAGVTLAFTLSTGGARAKPGQVNTAHNSRLSRRLRRHAARGYTRGSS